MNCKAIIFDLDGTLANTLPVCVRAFQDTLQHFCNRTLSEEEVYAHFGPSEEGILESIVPGRLSETLPVFADIYRRDHYLCQAPFPGVEKLLKTAKDHGMRTGIVTGKGRRSADISLEILGIGRLLDRVEVGFSHGADKPRSIRLMLADWGIAPAQAAYVGDMPSDMESARAAGVLPLGAAWAETATVRPGADGYQCFERVEDLIQWVENVNRED
jgi:phosphoglycolate phosphatase-like HAD superfamily hydrolase